MYRIEEMSASHSSNRRLISRIYKYLNNIEKINNGKMTLTDTSQKKSKWPINI
jgi:hypothetical protein